MKNTNTKDKNIKDEETKKQEELIKNKLEQQDVVIDKRTGKFIYKG